MRHFVAMIAVACSASWAFGGTMTIASQDFESNSLSSGTSSNTGFTSSTGVAFDGLGLGWTASITNGPISGSDSSDLIGVVNETVASGPGSGSDNNLQTATNRNGNWYHVDDADGTFALTFSPVDTTGFSSLMFDFAWAFAPSTYEASDFFRVSVNGTNVFEATEPVLDVTSNANQFTDVSLDLSAFDGQVLDIVFSVSNNAGGEDIGFDSLVLSGSVPEPSAFACFAIGCLGLGAIRRRRG
ncbi:MAG: PEP-CTERM sorting domain-containing protein [Planctomycetota bacterium]